MKVTCLVGLPGSGKTHLGRRLAGEQGDIWSFFDDLSQPRKPASEPHWPTQFDRFVERLKNPDTKFLIIADVFLCEADLREKAETTIRHYRPDVEIEWVFFENDVEKCRKNVIRRNDGREVEGSLRRFSKSYTIPEGVTSLLIWQGNSDATS